MKKVFKFKKGENAYDKKRREEIINYLYQMILKKSDDMLSPVFKKDTKLTIILE